MKSLPPTSETLRVSTITAHGSIGQFVSLRSFFDHVPISAESCHLSYEMVKFRDDDLEYHQRGAYPPSSRKRSLEDQQRSLRNQATVLQCLHDANLSKLHYVSVKVFRNGAVHMAGLRTVEHGIDVIRQMIKTIKDIGEDANIVPSLEGLHTSDADFKYKVVMINSDFRVPFMIKCKQLHILIRRDYGIRCMYEQCNKAGVKIYYDCIAENSSKTVTIMVCRTGSVIITGATSTEQLPLAKDFITNILYTHKLELELDQPKPLSLKMDAMSLIHTQNGK